MTELAIEHHGLPVDKDGRRLLDTDPLHLRIVVEVDEDGDVLWACELTDLRREDGTCRVCRPEIVQRPTLRAVETTKPCQGCHKPIQPGQLYYGGAKKPRHIGC